VGNHKQGQDRERERYQQLFGLPAEQIRFFHELTDEQVQEVRYYFPEWKADW